MSDDDPFYRPNLTPAPARVARPGELLFEFAAGERRFRFEIRDQGDHGVECQIFRGDESGRAVASIRDSTECGSRGMSRFSGPVKCGSSSRRIRMRRLSRERSWLYPELPVFGGQLTYVRTERAGTEGETFVFRMCSARVPILPPDGRIRQQPA